MPLAAPCGSMLVRFRLLPSPPAHSLHASNVPSCRVPVRRFRSHSASAGGALHCVPAAFSEATTLSVPSSPSPTCPVMLPGSCLPLSPTPFVILAVLVLRFLHRVRCAISSVFGCNQHPCVSHTLAAYACERTCSTTSSPPFMGCTPCPPLLTTHVGSHAAHAIILHIGPLAHGDGVHTRAYQH